MNCEFVYFIEYKEIKNTEAFEIVSKNFSQYGGGGSRTPVLTNHPSASTGLDPADCISVPFGSWSVLRGTQGVGGLYRLHPSAIDKPKLFTGNRAMGTAS